MNKTKTYYSILLTLCLTACSLISDAQKQNSKGFFINGHIDGIENGTKVYLHDIDEKVKIDSAFTINGNFILKGHVERPTACWLICRDEYAILMVENTKMEFRSPLKNMRLEAVVKGGKEQQLENELFALQYPYEKLCSILLDSLMQGQFNDKAQRKAVSKKHNDYVDSAQQVYINFGRRHPNTYVGLDIIYRNRQSIGKDSIKSLYEQLGKELRSSAKGQALHTFIYSELAQKGKKFIDFEAQTIDGIPFKLSSLKGNYILLSFWEAGCPPCRLENRRISKDYSSFKDKIAVVSFSLDKNKNTWQEASKDDNIVWTNVSDGKGEAGAIKALYDVQGIPTSFLINKEGIIIEKFIGLEDDFLTQIEKLVSGDQAAANKNDSALVDQ